MNSPYSMRILRWHFKTLYKKNYGIPITFASSRMSAFGVWRTNKPLQGLDYEDCPKAIL